MVELAVVQLGHDVVFAGTKFMFTLEVAVEETLCQRIVWVVPIPHCSPPLGTISGTEDPEDEEEPGAPKLNWLLVPWALLSDSCMVKVTGPW
jgi:hypothetical protein